MALTHAELVEIGAKYAADDLGCGLSVITEPARSILEHGETPDVWGYSSVFGCSFLIECKVSRGDFLADLRKPWRRSPDALGERRLYLSEPGVINREDLPVSWGLLLASGEGVISEAEAEALPCGRWTERRLLVAALCGARQVLGRYDQQAGPDWMTQVALEIGDMDEGSEGFLSDYVRWSGACPSRMSVSKATDLVAQAIEKGHPAFAHLVAGRLADRWVVSRR